MVNHPIIEREQPRLLSVAEAARLLGISQPKAWALIASGEIRSIKLGGRRLVARAEIGRIEAAAVEGEGC